VNFRDHFGEIIHFRGEPFGLVGVGIEVVADPLRAGLSARYLGSIERADVSASLTVLVRLARALSISPCELIQSRSCNKAARAT
jgi:hypothetical protein